MKILELFKGTGSVSKYYAGREDVEVISLDILKKYNPTYCCDIMEWDYKSFEVGEFDMIWASPECKIYSMLQNTHIGRKWKDKDELTEEREKHSCFIQRTIDIIKYLKPEYYFIENPRHSAIWKYIDAEFEKEHVLVDYCRFGTIYKKPTKILTNKKLDNMFCVCENKKHKFKLGITSDYEVNLSGRTLEKEHGDYTSLNERYSVPQKLLSYLFEN